MEEKKLRLSRAVGHYIDTRFPSVEGDSFSRKPAFRAIGIEDLGRIASLAESLDTPLTAADAAAGRKALEDACRKMAGGRTDKELYMANAREEAMRLGNAEIASRYGQLLNSPADEKPPKKGARARKGKGKELPRGIER